MNEKTPKPKYGLYSKYFTAEEIAWLDEISTEEFIKQVKSSLLKMALELLYAPGLTARERLQVINLLKRLAPK